MIRRALCLLAFASASPALAAQDHSSHDQPMPAQDPHAGHHMPAPAPSPPPPSPPPASDQHAGHHLPAPPPAEDPHAGHHMPAPAADQPIGNAPPPPIPTDHAADAVFGADQMAPSRLELRRAHGGSTGSMVLFDLAELQVRHGKEGYNWQAEAWFGGDINRLQVTTEGEGTFGEAPESAEVQVLYSRAVAPFWNLQAGLRHDFRPDPSRSHVVVGIEGVAPYWFHIDGQLFLSNKGELTARAEVSYDQRITQKLVLSPRVEFNLSAQDMPVLEMGSGLTQVDAGLRLRYEVQREFAPYIGVEWSGKVGQTARYARLHGEDPGTVNFVAGIRFWF